MNIPFVIYPSLLAIIFGSVGIGWTLRHRSAMAELSRLKKEWDIDHHVLLRRAHHAEADADRLAALVDQIVADLRKTAHIFSDDSPPITKELEALRLHDEARLLRKD